MTDFRTPDETYAAEIPALLQWLIMREDVTDAQQTGVYSIGVVFESGERLDIALQWRPPGEIGDASPERDDVTAVTAPVRPRRAGAP